MRERCACRLGQNDMGNKCAVGARGLTRVIGCIKGTVPMPDGSPDASASPSHSMVSVQAASAHLPREHRRAGTGQDGIMVKWGQQVAQKRARIC